MTLLRCHFKKLMHYPENSRKHLMIEAFREGGRERARERGTEGEAERESEGGREGGERARGGRERE